MRSTGCLEMDDLDFEIALNELTCVIKGLDQTLRAYMDTHKEEVSSEHTHNEDKAYYECPACRKEQRAEITYDVEYWGGTVTWDEELNQ